MVTWNDVKIIEGVPTLHPYFRLECVTPFDWCGCRIDVGTHSGSFDQYTMSYMKRPVWTFQGTSIINTKFLGDNIINANNLLLIKDSVISNSIIYSDNDKSTTIRDVYIVDSRLNLVSLCDRILDLSGVVIDFITLDVKKTLKLKMSDGSYAMCFSSPRDKSRFIHGTRHFFNIDLFEKYLIEENLKVVGVVDVK